MPNPAKPTALKVLHGTARPDRANPKEPKPQSGIPRVPAHLTAKAKTAFKQLAKEFDACGVLTVLDSKALELLCDAYGEYRDLRKQVEVEGHTITVLSTQGEPIPKAHPAVAMMHKARDSVLTMLREFGATPAARTKVQTNEEPEVDPLEEFLKARH